MVGNAAEKAARIHSVVGEKHANELACWIRPGDGAGCSGVAKCGWMGQFSKVVPDNRIGKAPAQTPGRIEEGVLIGGHGLNAGRAEYTLAFVRTTVEHGLKENGKVIYFLK